MKYVTLLDVETTGLDPMHHRAIEVAVQVYDLENACAVASYAELIREDSNEAESINGISPASLAHASESNKVWWRVLGITEGVDVFVAHRAEFDRQFVPELLREKQWACTKTDFKWPGGLRGESLVQLALGLGLGVASAHRAMTDVDTMSRILTRVKEKGHDLQELFRLALRPKVRVVAQVPFEMNEEIKKHGFLFDWGRKQWYRHMPPEDMKDLPFRAVVLA